MTHASAPVAALRLPGALQAPVEAAIDRAVTDGWARRLWARDSSLWTADERAAAAIGERLGWLDAAHQFRERVEELEAFAEGIRREGFGTAVVCGMGGSSLTPEVLARSLPLGEAGLRIHVLDSTDPLAVRAVGSAADPMSSLYLIASKSGTTTETLAFLAHFWQVQDDLHVDIPASAAGQHFAAITDPGASLDAIPHTDLFRNVFLNPPDVGGRYSALTYVGLAPAALMGLDLGDLLDDAVLMAERCREPEAGNPGLWLGAALGALAAAGRDKLTFVIEPRIASFADWAEQLVAESTGKDGHGIIPVVGEALAGPDAYEHDRIFVRIGSTADDRWLAQSGASLDALATASHPVIDLATDPSVGLGGEFVRWMFATAFAGAALGVNPFDEPNVSESKANTARVLEDFRRGGRLAGIETLASEPPLVLIGDAPLRLSGNHGSVAEELRRHLDRVRPRGYFGLQAYIAPTARHQAALREVQAMLRDGTRRAVTLGFGPRFLHSTGQLHKGGPPTGCFIQLTADHPEDLPIPGRRETFGTLIDAQAVGDFQALEAHDLPVLRVHLGRNVEVGLASLGAALAEALG